MTKESNTIKLHQEVMEAVPSLNLKQFEGHFEAVGSGQVDEVFNRTGRPNLYYQWLSALIKLKQPKQVVELGAAAGVSTIVMSLFLDPESKLYSVDIDPMAWRWLTCDYKPLVKILGDDLNMNIWPEDVDLNKTDLWFFDAEHTGEHLAAELDLYSPFFKKGTIVAFDDINLNEGMRKVWDAIEWDKLDISDVGHYSGWGFCIV